MKLTPEVLSDLAAKAKAAQPWRFTPRPSGMSLVEKGGNEADAVWYRDHDGDSITAKGREIMAHIAAANPETVLALVKRVRELEKEHEEDQGVIRVWRGRTERAEELLRDALASDLGWEDTEWGPKAAKIVGEP